MNTILIIRIRKGIVMTYNDEELIQITESLKQEWLDKACKWLNNNLIDYWSRQNGHPATFINDFKKAMEK